MSDKPKSSLSIALGIQRQSRRKKMADGGMIHDAADQRKAEIESEISSKYDDSGSRPEPYNPMDDDQRHSSAADAIMSQRKKMSHGGLIEEDADDEDAFYDLNDDPSTENVPEHIDYKADGHGMEDEDDHDMDLVSRIRRKMRG